MTISVEIYFFKVKIKWEKETAAVPRCSNKKLRQFDEFLTLEIVH